jgi:hypothetical protein
MQRNARLSFGIVLILAGILLLAQRLSFIGGKWDDAIMTLAFGTGTLYFASLFFSERSRWWAALVAFIFLGLAASQFIEVFLPGVPGAYVCASTLLLMGLGFMAIYFIDRQMWWALIPGGVMLSLTGVVLLEELVPKVPFEPAGLLFLGLGLTFLVLYFLRTQGTRLTWAIYPALSLLLFGLFIGFGNEDLWNIIWPSIIVLLGVYFIFGAFRRK